MHSNPPFHPHCAVLVLIVFHTSKKKKKKATRIEFDVKTLSKRGVMQPRIWTSHADVESIKSDWLSQTRDGLGSSVRYTPGSSLQGTCEMIMSYVTLDVQRRCRFGLEFDDLKLEMPDGWCGKFFIRILICTSRHPSHLLASIMK